MAVIVDSYSESNHDAESSLKDIHPSDSEFASLLGQSFTGDGKSMDSCEFYLKRVGSPGNLIATLYAHTGTFGTSSQPTGSALDSSNTVAAGGFSSADFALISFSGFSGYTLVNGTKYCICVEGYDGTWDADNYIWFGADVTSSTHAGNYFRYVNSDWAIHGTLDGCFYVYGVAAAPSGWAGGDLNGVALATIAKINGVAIADIEKVNGI